MNEIEGTVGDGLPTIGTAAEALLTKLNAQWIADSQEADAYLDYAIGRSLAQPEEFTGMAMMAMWKLFQAYDLYIDLGIEIEFEVVL